jgi:hypothetical protein
MAVTITRSVWIDDDGTGQTGTVINQALHTTLYNEIDTALAKVAQLAGGNTFTGNQTITGAHTITGTQSVGLGIGANGALTATYGTAIAAITSVSLPGGIALQNYNPNNTCNYILFYNSATAVAGSIGQNGATGVIYGTASDARLKDDAGRATDLSALRAVVVHDFTWKADGTCARGVFAQEAREVFPRAITEGTNETTEGGALARPWMTDYSKFVPDLIVGWQQHDAELATVRAALAALSTVP